MLPERKNNFPFTRKRKTPFFKKKEGKKVGNVDKIEEQHRVCEIKSL